LIRIKKSISLHYTHTGKKFFHGEDEDYLKIKANIFAVFDGVTLLFQDPYPLPSPARMAAKQGVNAFIDYVQRHKNKKDKLALIRDAFEEGNKTIKRLNIKLGLTPGTVDYLSKQYAATVGAAGLIEKDMFYFGQVNDCGVIVMDCFGKRKVDLVADDTAFREYTSYLGRLGRYNGAVERHKYVRRSVVNNYNLEYEGKKVNFGVMTGEVRAMQFLRVGAIQLEKGDALVCYSDGFLPHLRDEEFVEKLRGGNKGQMERKISALEKAGAEYQKEKSLITVYV